MVPEIFGSMSAYDLGYAIGAILGSLFIAFFGFRFFKPLIVIEMALMGYGIGSELLGIFISEDAIGFNAAPILGIAVAIILAIFSFKIYKAIIYSCGGVMGFSLGLVVPLLFFLMLDLDVVGGIVGLIVGILLIRPGAKLMMKLAKPLYIMSMAMTGMSTALYYLGVIIVGEESGLIMAFSFAGFVLGIFAMVAQFKMNKDRAFEL